MELVVDLRTGALHLRDPDDFGRFAVRVSSGQEGDGAGTDAVGALAASLSVHDAGRVDHDGDAFVPPEAVRRLAVASGAATGPGWEHGFEEMLAYASTRGWIADDGAIRAHVEWGGA